MEKTKTIHNYTTHDFSAVNHHVNELTKRSSVATSVRRTEIFKTYAIYGALLAVALGIGGWLILKGVAALFMPEPQIIEKEVVVEKPIAFEPNIYVSQQQPNSTAIDSVRDKARSVASRITNSENEPTVNFVIFKEIPFSKEGLSGVTIGMRYKDSNENLPSRQWCYTERFNSENTKVTISLAKVEDGDRTNVIFTQSDADKVFTSTKTLLEAQQVCSFR